MVNGGALLQDMRLLVCQWTDGLAGEDAVEAANRILRKPTRVRAAYTFTRAFKPRFISGDPPDAWKLARVVEENHPPLEVARAFYYWLTARAEPMLHRFVVEEMWERTKAPDREIRIQETSSWVRKAAEQESIHWTPTVCLRMAQAIQAALRDFGILEGGVRKRIAAQQLPLEAFCLIAFCLHRLGVRSKALVSHVDWRLFLLGRQAVERLFLESDQHGWIDYQCIGEIYRIEFPTEDFKRYAHDLLGG